MRNLLAGVAFVAFWVALLWIGWAFKAMAAG